MHGNIDPSLWLFCPLLSITISSPVTEGNFQNHLPNEINSMKSSDNSKTIKKDRFSEQENATANVKATECHLGAISSAQLSKSKPLNILIEQSGDESHSTWKARGVCSLQQHRKINWN